MERMDETMGRKLVLGTLLVGLIGILVAGGVIRTLDKTENVAEARGLGADHNDAYAEDGERQGQGWGRGPQQDEGGVERQYVNHESVTTEQVSYEGIVVQTQETGDDLFIKTEDGQEIKVGTGPGNMEAQGFTLQEGERVTVRGYWEDEELKATVVTRLRDGESISLRDAAGRPAWAGSGKRATERQATEAGTASVLGAGAEVPAAEEQVQAAEEQVQAAGEPALGAVEQGQEQGRGRGNNGQGQGGFGNQTSGQAGVGQAQVNEWVTLKGIVVQVDANALVVEDDSGGLVTVENRPWWFAQEQGFVAGVRDEVTLTGFYENGEFEVGQLGNLTSGMAVEIREASGRPGWAGRGRGGG